MLGGGCGGGGGGLLLYSVYGVKGSCAISV